MTYLVKTTGFFYLTPGMLVMWCIAVCLMYLAIAKNYEPLLLLPIGFGILLANLPLAGLMTPDEGLLWKFYHFGIQWEVIPPLIFLGLGALTDFGPMLARPSLLFLVELKNVFQFPEIEKLLFSLLQLSCVGWSS